MIIVRPDDSEDEEDDQEEYQEDDTSLPPMADSSIFGELVQSAPPEVDKTTALYVFNHLHQYYEAAVDRNIVPSDDDFRTVERHIGPDAKQELWRRQKAEQDHRHAVENAPHEAERRASWMQFIIALATLGVGLFAIIVGQTAVAVAIFGTAMVAVGVVAFAQRRSISGP